MSDLADSLLSGEPTVETTCSVAVGGGVPLGRKKRRKKKKRLPIVETEPSKQGEEGDHTGTIGVPEADADAPDLNQLIGMKEEDENSGFEITVEDWAALQAMHAGTRPDEDTLAWFRECGLLDVAGAFTQLAKEWLAGSSVPSTSNSDLSPQEQSDTPSATTSQDYGNHY